MLALIFGLRQQKRNKPVAVSVAAHIGSHLLSAIKNKLKGPISRLVHSVAQKSVSLHVSLYGSIHPCSAHSAACDLSFVHFTVAFCLLFFSLVDQSCSFVLAIGWCAVLAMWICPTFARLFCFRFRVKKSLTMKVVGALELHNSGRSCIWKFQMPIYASSIWFDGR